MMCICVTQCGFICFASVNALASSLANGPLLVELVARNATIDGSMNRIIACWPQDHATGIPYFVTLLQECSVKDISDIRVSRCLWILWNLIHHTDQHEDLIAFAAPVQEALAAPEPERHMLLITIASSAAHNTLRSDGGHEHGILNGAERADERRGLEVLVQFDDAKNVPSTRCNHRETHITTELLVALLWEILRIHDGALRTNAPVPVGVDEAEVGGIACHQCLHILWHGFRVQLEILWQDTPPVAVLTPCIQLARCCGQRLSDLRALGHCGE
mmetsp:Transcript_40952/g.76223  ORF Transcript_40952/g.76223 Transcript_40952/m.76223 type:complete len:274 (+) Transcript_40952:3-824(+)